MMIKYAKVVDYSNWEAGKSCNGGCYSFSREYIWNGSSYNVEFGTSAEFYYCEYCGSFYNIGDNQHDYCKENPYTVEYDELTEILDTLIEDEVITNISFMEKAEEISIFFKNIVTGKRTECIKKIELAQNNMNTGEYAFIFYNTKNGGIVTSRSYKKGEIDSFPENLIKIGRFTKFTSPQKVMNKWK